MISYYLVEKNIYIKKSWQNICISQKIPELSAIFFRDEPTKLKNHT